MAGGGAGSKAEGQLPGRHHIRSRGGHDVAVEALREAIGTHEATPAEVMQWARVDRVGAVVRLCLEALQ